MMPFSLRAVRLWAVLVISLSGLVSSCDCETSEIQELAPVLKAVYGVPGEDPLCKIEDQEDCSHRFVGTLEEGALNIGSGVDLTFILKNPSPADLRVKSIAFDSVSDSAFRLVGQVPELISAGQELPLKVYVGSNDQGEKSGTLVIESNAKNLPSDTPMTIAFSANFIRTGAPDIQLVPERCDFGSVGIGATAFCAVSIENRGNQPLKITDVGFLEGTDREIFGVPESDLVVFSSNNQILPGTSISFRVYGTPGELRDHDTNPYTGGMFIESDDPDEARVELPFILGSVDKPTAVPRIKTVNGADYFDGMEIYALDDVVISADQSLARGGATITGYEWTLISVAEGSSVQIEDPSRIDTGFSFERGISRASGLDVIGTYVVGLRVTDSNGAMSENTATLNISVLPGTGLVFQITWDTATDVDMHVLRNDGEMCSNDDCFFANCAARVHRINWGSPAQTAHLDVDNVTGYGPENTNIDVPADEQYKVALHKYAGDARTNVNLKVFIGGSLNTEVNSVLGDTGETINPLVVNYSGGVGTVSLTNQTTPDNEPGGQCGAGGF
jgi:hypothetical protein